MEANVIRETELIKPTFNEDVIVKIPKEMPDVEHNLDVLKDFSIKLKEYYSKLVFSDENSKEAEAEKTKINKLIKTVSDLRKEKVAEYKKPIDDFEKTAKEIEKLLNEAKGNVQVYIDKAELIRKEEKEKKVIEPIVNEAITNAFINGGYLIDKNKIVYDKKWYNKTFKSQDIKNDVDNQVSELIRLENEYQRGLEIIKSTIEMATQMSVSRDYDKYAERFTFTRDLTAILEDIKNENNIRENSNEKATICIEPQNGLAYKDNSLFTTNNLEYNCKKTFIGTEEQMNKLIEYAKKLGMEMM